MFAWRRFHRVVLALSLVGGAAAATAPGPEPPTPADPR
jgi:hypothetical protein